ncbi:hypothetical protein ACWGKS_26980 [Nocardiopsis sp. NPDC055879]
MSARYIAARVRTKAIAANRATQPGTPEFKTTSSVAAALYITEDIDRARHLITHAAHIDDTTRANALDLLHQLTEQENTTP